MATWQVAALIASLSLLPPLVFVFWLRSRERDDRNPVRVTFGAYIYGGTVGIAVALLLHNLFDIGFAAPGVDLVVDASVLSLVVVAPVVEEVAKGMGLVFLRPHIRELEDGIIYGAALGLGFAATENLFYGINALQHGTEFAVWTLVLRIFSSMLLHLGASAILGFGYARILLGGHVGFMLLPYYLVATMLHAMYNFLVTLDGVGLWALGSALVMVVLVVMVLHRWIQVLDTLPHQRA